MLGVIAEKNILKSLFYVIGPLCFYKSGNVVCPVKTLQLITLIQWPWIWAEVFRAASSMTLGTVQGPHAAWSTGVTLCAMQGPHGMWSRGVTLCTVQGAHAVWSELRLQWSHMCQPGQVLPQMPWIYYTFNLNTFSVIIHSEKAYYCQIFPQCPCMIT